MSANNPDITASDVIADVEARLGSPGISNSVYLPWVSFAYAKTFAALANSGQEVKERLFGNYITFSLNKGIAEYALSTYIPRFGSLIKAEILYGGTGDDWVKLKRLRSLSQWNNQNNVSTSYRAKENALIYFIEDKFGIIPTPPSSDAAAPTFKTWYVRRPYQITNAADVIDIEYRFIYPVADYVQAKAIEKKFEDYTNSAGIEAKFEHQLQEIQLVAASEINENDDTNAIEVDANSPLFDNPL